jgi:hypothetical protein
VPCPAPWGSGLQATVSSRDESKEKSHSSSCVAAKPLLPKSSIRFGEMNGRGLGMGSGC